jgi:hypothetical protein
MPDRKIQLLRAAPTGVAPAAPGGPQGGRGAQAAAPSPHVDPETAWREVLGHLDDDAFHKAFIGACMRQHRMQLALDNYRMLERLRPGDPVASRYVAQVGKAMELGALGVSGERQRELQSRLLARPMRVLVALVVAIVGMMAIYSVVQVAKAALTTKPPPTVTHAP